MNLAQRNVALLAAAVALAVPTTLQLLADAESFVDINRIPLLFDGFTAENCGSIAIGQPKKEQPPPNPQNPNQKQPLAYDQVSLVRTEKGWALAQAPGAAPSDLAGAPVAKDKVESDVFQHLRKIRSDKESTVRAAATPEQLKEYGLDEAQAILIKVSDRNNQAMVAELYLGNEAGAQFTGSEGVQGRFVRRTDSNDVLLYEYDKAWYLSTQADTWIDKTLLKVDPTLVQRIALRNAATGGKTITVQKLDGKASWTCAEAPAGRGAVRQSEVENFVQRLRWLNVQDFRLPLARAGNLAALGLQPPQLELEFDYLDGDSLRTAKFAVGNQVEGKNEYYLTSSENTFLMTWPAGLVTGLELDVAATWFDPAAPVAEPEASKSGDSKPNDK
jgi:hypothetical protein